MHRQVIIVSHNMFVDHINRKGLDNRKANLRPATATQNSCNRAKYKRPSHCSEFKGVSCNKSKKPWKAQIRVNRKYIHLGSFCDEVSAAKAYDKAANKYHGQFAFLNFPETKQFVPYRVLSLLRAFLKYIAYFSSRFAVLNFPETKRSLFCRVRSLARAILNYLIYLFKEPVLSFLCHSERNYPACHAKHLCLGRSGEHCRRSKNLNFDIQHSLFDIRYSSSIIRRSSSVLCRPSPIVYTLPPITTNIPLTAQPAIRKVAMMAKTLYIIDGHAHIYAAYFAPMTQRLTSPTGEPTKAVYIFTRAILGLIQRQNPDMLAVAMDSKTPTFRSEIYAEYKAHRPPMPDDMPMQINRIEEILDALNIPVLRLDGFEADDVIGTLAKKAAADGYDCLICSKDKDILQLLTSASEGTGVISAFDIKTDTRKDVATMVETMLVTPQQFLSCLALQGDATDNVPGIPDVGPKTALVWIQKYGSIENLYKHIDEIKGKRGDNLRKFKDKLTLSKDLVTIDCNVPIQIDYDALALKEFDKQKLAQIFTELGFNRLLTQLDLKESPAPVQDTSHSTGRLTAESRVKSDGQPDLVKTLSPDYQLIDTQKKFDEFFTQLKKQKIFAIDTETTSMFAMRADLVGISFSWKEPSTTSVFLSRL